MSPSQQTEPLLVVLGPTASGKTRLGVQLAGATGGEIISADSRQVYRGMDIGTGKDLAEYGEVPYHLINIRNPDEEFSLYHFQRECLATIAELNSRGRLPVLVGGTGLYLESVLRGHLLPEVPENSALRNRLASLSLHELQEVLRQSRESNHNTTDLLDRDRLLRAIEIAEYTREHGPEPLPDFVATVLGIRWERDVLRKRITARLRQRLEEGMIDEVRALHDSGISWERLDYFGLEYRFIGQHLRGELNRNDLFQKLNSAIHDFAKRQETWFRRMERNGILIHWLEGAGNPLAEALDILSVSGLAPYVR